MKAMRPDQISREIERQKQKDLQDRIFVVLMLIVLPIVFMGMVLFDIVS